MKKITLFFAFLWTFLGYSQVRNYTFSQTIGSYTEITPEQGSSSLGNVNSDNQFFVDPTKPLGASNAVTGPGIPIGFNFIFNGKVYDRFGVSNEGWISLGNSSITPDAVNMNIGKLFPLSDATTIVPNDLTARIAALTNDIKAQEGASLSYQTLGDIPGERVLVVQWKNYRKVTNGDGDSFNFQIRLNETSNVVQIVYGGFETNAGPGTVYQVGLRAEPAGVASNFVNRTTASSWTKSVAGTVATDRMLLSNLVRPSKGLTFAWTPPTCGGAKDLTVTAITTSSATLNWNSYIPTPNGYEYLYSTSSALPTGSGTPTTAKTASLTDLEPSTVYNVFMRTNCGSQYSPWLNVGTFKTKCIDATGIFEDFDSYTASVNPQIVPECMERIVTGKAEQGVVTIANEGGSNRLYLVGNAFPGNESTVYAVLPPVSNLQASTHRLKFKAYSTDLHKTIDVGYFQDSNDPNTFQSKMTIDLPSTAANATEVIYSPKDIPNEIKNLVFRNSGNSSTGAKAYIDNVVWEPIPVCADVTAIVAKEFTHNSARVIWNKGASETNWQYAYALPSVSNPYSLTGIDVTANPDVTIAGLQPSTTYKVWIRSKCNATTFGAWVGPVILSTTCAPVAEFVENFDAVTVNLPSCWSKIGTNGTFAISNLKSPAIAPSAPNSLEIKKTATAFTIVSLPPLSNTAAGNHQLRYKLRASASGVTVDLGYLTDITDPGSFQPLEEGIAPPVNTFKEFISTFGSAAQSPVLAFKSSGSAGSIFIDDVVWEPQTACQSVSSISADIVKSTTAKLKWTVNGFENQWQYVVAPASVGNPYGLKAIDVANPEIFGSFVSGSISGLSPATAYKVWLRSKCDATSFGSWDGPVLITTSCAPISDFSQNFDAGSNFPTCWSKVGITGQVGISSDSTVPSYPYALNLAATSVTSPAVVAMPAVNNASSGGYQLTFKYRASADNVKLDYGFVLNLADSASFIPTQTELTCTTSYQTATIVFQSDEVLSEVLAFRNTAMANIFIDDVVWKSISGVTAPANDDAIGAVALNVGQEFSSNSVVGTTVGATASNVDVPGCGGYNGMDVWYSTVVPQSGNVTFEINGTANGITNSAAAVYSGTSLIDLDLVECADSGSTAGGDHPKINIVGRTPGEVLYLRVWENGGDTSGSFVASAYTANLDANDFEDVRFSFYPNPVSDVLNLSFSQEIKNVNIFNVLGQEVISRAVNDNNTVIDMSGLYTGTYLVKVTAGNQTKTIRIIKK